MGKTVGVKREACCVAVGPGRHGRTPPRLSPIGTGRFDAGLGTNPLTGRWRWGRIGGKSPTRIFGSGVEELPCSPILLTGSNLHGRRRPWHGSCKRPHRQRVTEVIPGEAENE